MRAYRTGDAMKLFYAGTGAVVVALVMMSLQWRGGVGNVTSFYGVVDTAETVVSAELPVEIVRVHVVPGQLVREGDPLVDLASGELERNIAELRHGLNETRAARLAEDREIQAQVAEYEAQYKLNRSLLTLTPPTTKRKALCVPRSGDSRRCSSAKRFLPWTWRPISRFWNAKDKSCPWWRQARG
jgi:multidrug resistance efflux pump